MSERELSLSDEQQQASGGEIQRLFFELFGRVHDNELDGECVVNDLLEWRDLWHSVLPARFPYSFRDRNERWDSWPADALYIWTSVEILPELRRRVEERWKADELVVISPERDEEMHLANIDNEDDRVLYVWWD
ncbi:MAG: hypothetical protein AUF64_01420 [Chloroflexi bacterium 13_1_20CM_54_36]|nr:MAG: hypothetical protein AUF64_01420 [Chloroflexi bacterium 13_1_20CM_54_36]